MARVLVVVLGLVIVALCFRLGWQDRVIEDLQNQQDQCMEGFMHEYGGATHD